MKDGEKVDLPSTEGEHLEITVREKKEKRLASVWLPEW
jgi:hypothetical protein